MVRASVGADRSDPEGDRFPGGDVVGECEVEVLGDLADRQIPGECGGHAVTWSMRVMAWAVTVGSGAVVSWPVSARNRSMMRSVCSTRPAAA
jgi:hypothetical protein